MTTPNSNSPPGSVENIDTGPLSWVMVEIRESLNRSRAALQEALTQDAETQPTTLRHAKSFLHQAHGAVRVEPAQHTVELLRVGCVHQHVELEAGLAFGRGLAQLQAAHMRGDEHAALATLDLAQNGFTPHEAHMRKMVAAAQRQRLVENGFGKREEVPQRVPPSG